MTKINYPARYGMLTACLELVNYELKNAREADSDDMKKWHLEKAERAAHISEEDLARADAI